MVSDNGPKCLDLDKAEADVALQPIVSVAGGSVVAYEALLRVRAAGAVVLLPQALMTGGVPPRLLGRLEREAHARALALRARCFPGKTLFLNVSPDAFVLEPEAYAAYLGQQRDVVVEIPERSCPMVGDVARRLHQLGVPIALDDFGAGTADLERLVALRPEYVKIDRKLVAGLGCSERRHRLVRHLAGLIKAMGATPIAEGVEASEDAAALPAAGIYLAQGYHFAAPVPRTLFEHEEVVPGNEALAGTGCRTGHRR